MSLTRSMQQLSKKYNDALNQKCLKWSMNSGVTYSDLTYSTLMHPGSANNNKPYLLTTASGKVVLDEKYSKYAKLISEDGKSGGDYQSHRSEILSDIMGISKEKFDSANLSGQLVNENVSSLEEAIEARDKARAKAFKKIDAKKIAAKWGTIEGINFAQKTSGTVDLGGANDAKSKLSNIGSEIIKSMERYLDTENYNKFKESTEAYINNLTANIADNDKCKESIQSGSTEFSGSYDNVKLDMSKFLDGLFGSYQGTQEQNSAGKIEYETIDKNTAEWKVYQNAEQLVEYYKGEYSASVDADNQIFDAAQETEIKFYDQIFTAIAEKGWVVDNGIDNSDYLNQMLQNNQYLITTMTEKDEDSSDYNVSSGVKDSDSFEYSTDIASNVKNIFSVNDDAIRQKALSEYEYEKSIINIKEQRNDTRRTNLETEQSAINQMIQGIQTVEKDNIDKYFAIFA